MWDPGTRAVGDESLRCGLDAAPAGAQPVWNGQKGHEYLDGDPQGKFPTGYFTRGYLLASMM